MISFAFLHRRIILHCCGVFFLLINSGICAQTPTIDSLKHQITLTVNDSIKSHLYERLGYEYLYFKPDSALLYIDRAITIAELAKNKSASAAGYNRKGTYYVLQSKYPEAIVEFQKALPFFKKTKDSVGLAESYCNLGALDFYLRDYDSSLANFQEASNYIDSLKQVNLYSKLITNLSGVYREKQQYDSSLYYAKKAIDYIKNDKENRIIAVIYFNLGTAQYYLNQYDIAISSLNHAIAQPDIPVQFKILSKSYKSQALLALGKVEEANDELQDLEAQVESLNDQYVALEFYKSKQKVFEAKENTVEALNYAKKYIELNNDIHNREQTAILQNIKVKFDTEEREFENEILRADSEIQAIQIKNQRYGIWGIAIFIFLLLLMVLIIYGMYNLKAKNNTILKDKQSVLNEYNRNLTTINREKNKFFSIVAHDVKSPVAAILSSANMLHSNLESFTSEELEKLASELKSQSSNLHYLLEHVLIWAKSQMDGFKFVSKEINLKVFIEHLYNNELVFIKRKDIKILCNISADIVLISDPQVVQVVLRNLLNNAIKFTPNGGVITFDIEEKKNFHYIHVSDTGVGMTQDKIEKVLVNKERYTVEGTANEVGNGIGLILCQEIAKKAGGEITATSSVGKGSTFTLALPVLKD
ncbi:tetratricopeptide repeat-containing sensor histidine kinase [Leeuwenhoekiella marinoflava]|uniref:histidine kinase n=2 Tax=Leeuwenhoekiella marinoflava TaxID=988 RepID=A0A4V1KS32_9FLAO|nr:ATP-binding protein [Leeuwenhoekiella marinoflava]RXG27212.1 tetratricopeptide repeat protein [Leeuwenhoekiella marinoflava]SHF78833.1 Tetratricopeptide repeat-containing protein [Leeuwenhoekiella marinoflava DSM 3653]